MLHVVPILIRRHAFPIIDFDPPESLFILILLQMLFTNWDGLSQLGTGQKTSTEIRIFTASRANITLHGLSSNLKFS